MMKKIIINHLQIVLEMALFSKSILSAFLK